MNPRLQKLQRVLRDLGLLAPVDKLKYLVSIIKHSKPNRAFIAENPDFKLPPKALAYDAYSAPDWNFYKSSGEKTAKFMASIAKKYGDDGEVKRLVEWGCGPARVLRHIPASFNEGLEVYGTDYNPATIEWCSSNIPGINFFLNGLKPPLPFEADFFDFLYSISVFTHLSEEVGRQWMDELGRIVCPGGLLVISTNGDSRMSVMLPDEQKEYIETGVVIRGKLEEGKKMYWACHSPGYLRANYFNNYDVLEHSPAGFPHTGQDLWVLRKSA